MAGASSPRPTTRRRGCGGRTARASPDGQHIVTASYDKTARVWRADGTGEPVVLRDHENGVYSAEWSPDGQRIVTASKTARVWRADGTGEPVVLRGHDDWVQSAAWSPDGQRIVAASEDATARIWSVSTPVIRRALEQVTTVCLSIAARRTYLDEDANKARTEYEACERSYGRVPRETDDDPETELRPFAGFRFTRP